MSSVARRRIAAICGQLPEVIESTSWDNPVFKVSRRIIVNVTTVDSPTGDPVTVMTAQADPFEAEVMANSGHPFFRVRSTSAAISIGVVLDEATDWDEVAEIVTESYMIVAPKRLSALLDLPNSPES